MSNTNTIHTPNIWNVGSSNYANTNHWGRSSNLILGAPRDMIESRPTEPSQPTPYNGKYPVYYMDKEFVRLTAIQYYAWKNGQNVFVKDTVQPQVIYPPKEVDIEHFWDYWRPLKLSSNEIAHHRDMGTYWLNDAGDVIFVFGTGTWIQIETIRRETENTDPNVREATLEEFIPIFGDEVPMDEALRLSFNDNIYPTLEPLSEKTLDIFPILWKHDPHIFDKKITFQSPEKLSQINLN